MEGADESTELRLPSIMEFYGSLSNWIGLIVIVKNVSKIVSHVLHKFLGLSLTQTACALGT